MISSKNILSLVPALIGISLPFFSLHGNHFHERRNEMIPNVIFKLIDYQRWDTLEFAGNRILKTPEVDKMDINGCYIKDTVATNIDYTKMLNALRLKQNQFAKKYADPYSSVPEGLMVEHIREPAKTLINDSLPEFSWIVPKEAVFQKGYQILVSSEKDLINNNIGNIWNSGQVRSNKSINIEHAGKPLKENSSYFWKVRIWDQDNRLAEYSTVQKFKTGSFLKSVSSSNIFQSQKIEAAKISKTSEKGYLFDFGKDAFGTLEFDYKTAKKETITVSLGEKLINGVIDSKPGGTIRYSEINLTVIPGQTHYMLKLPADKRNTTGDAVQLPDSFGVVTPFRYAEIRNASQPIVKSSVYQKAYFHYFDDTQSDFSCSDTTLNKVWELCKYSIKATSFSGIYIDGDRERIAYEADAYINQLGHYSTDREYAMARRTIEHFMSHPTWPTEWLLHTVMMAYQDYLYTGDTELLRKYYTQLKHKTLIDLTREDGLISSFSPKITGSYMRKLGFSDTTKRIKDIVDWPPAQKDTGWKLSTTEGERDGYVMQPINTVVNCLFYNNMKIMAEIAGYLDLPDEKEKFELMAVKVRTAINQKLFNSEKGIYTDGEGTAHSSIHANMMALAFGIVPEKNLSTVAEFVKLKGIACSVYGAQYLLEGLYNADESQYALDLMRATTDRSWYNMIRSGSTITIEAWDMKYKPNSDWNHAWGAVPANIIPRYLWGIKPKTAGFGIVTIAPQMGNLKFSTIKSPTIRGTITGEYHLVSPRLRTWLLDLPSNMAGEFVVNLSEDEVMTLNGKEVNPLFHSIRLNPGMNKIEIKINTY